MKETMTAEQAVYHKLFLLNGLTECFDRDLDERLERENPLSDLTLALSTCGGKRDPKSPLDAQLIREKVVSDAKQSAYNRTRRHAEGQLSLF